MTAQDLSYLPDLSHIVRRAGSLIACHQACIIGRPAKTEDHARNKMLLVLSRLGIQQMNGCVSPIDRDRAAVMRPHRLANGRSSWCGIGIERRAAIDQPDPGRLILTVLHKSLSSEKNTEEMGGSALPRPRERTAHLFLPFQSRRAFPLLSVWKNSWIDLARHHGMDRQACQILYNCQHSMPGCLTFTS